MAEAPRRAFLPPRWFIRGAWLVHRALYRLTGGRFGLRKPTPKTFGMMTIHTTGRRSGTKRTAILGYYEDGPNLYTMAMNGWGEPEPAWWLNLQANPNATLVLPEGTREVTARAATGDERQRLGPRWLKPSRNWIATPSVGRTGRPSSCSSPAWRLEADGPDSVRPQHQTAMMHGGPKPGEATR